MALLSLTTGKSTFPGFPTILVFLGDHFGVDKNKSGDHFGVDLEIISGLGIISGLYISSLAVSDIVQDTSAIRPVEGVVDR